MGTRSIIARQLLMKKTPFPRMFVSAIVVIGLVGAVFPFGSVQGDTNLSGIINSNVTWTQAGSPYTLTGNLLVQKDVTLTINPGTTVNLGSYYIMVNGTLEAIGTADNPIVFNGGSIAFTSSSKAWNEQTQSGCIIENAILTTMISSENALKMNSNTINSALTVTSDTIVTNNIIKGNINGGIISGNTITGEANSANISYNNIKGTVSCSGIASNNYINGRIFANGNCVVTNNTIIGDTTSSADSIGIGVGSAYIGANGYPKIENNTIANNNVGISIGILIRSWFSINIPEIRNNLVTQNNIGIQYSISRQENWETNQTIIESNTITKNAIGVKIMGTAQEILIANNNIQQNTNYNIYLETTDAVNVPNNWWGTTDQSTITNSFYDFNKDFNLGKVNFVPFLTAPNPNAPAISTPTPTPSPANSPSPTPPPTNLPSPQPSPTLTPTPSQEPQQTPIEVILGAAITVTILGAGLALLVYLMKR